MCECDIHVLLSEMREEGIWCLQEVAKQCVRANELFGAIALSGVDIEFLVE